MKKLIFCMMALLAVVACSDSGTEPGGNGGGGQTPPKQPQITLNASAVDFPTEGGSREVTFNSSEAWTAQVVNNRADDWCFIEPASGAAGNASIVITTTENDTPDDRTASVIIKAGTVSKTVKVSQKQKDALTVTSSKFEVAAEGGEVVVEVKANIDFEYVVDDAAKEWISYEGTRAIQTSTLVFKIKANDDTEKREGKITIKSGELKETVNIYQAGSAPSIVISQNEYIVPSAGETIAVEVKSNVDVSIEIPQDANWIKENTTRGVSTNTYYFDISENENYDSRTAEIKFTNKENNIFEVVKITQSQKDAIVIASDNYMVDGDGGTIEIEVGHNVDFDVEIADDWITLQTTRAYETETMVFAIAENPSEESREGTITFISADGSLKQVVKVIQSNSAAEIIIALTSPTYYNDLIAQVSKTFGDSIYEITHIRYSTYSITLKKGHSGIPDYAFYDEDWEPNGGNTWLKSITICNGITSIGKDAFALCRSLESAIFGNNVTSIGEEAFWACDALKSIIIGDGVISIGDRAFNECDNLQNITIPNSVTSIGTSAFEDCIALENITIPGSVTSIGDEAFSWCEALKSVIIGDGVMSIGDYAFEGCENLQNITIPNSVTSIGDHTFEGCKNLQNITIPISVTSIGEGAFENCIVLENITIPNSVTSIGKGAFSGCEALSAFYGEYASSDNRCLIKDGELLAFAPADLTTYSIPNNVTKIGDSAFGGCEALESITIPNSVTSIGDYAFYHCSALESITIPNSVTSIGEGAFFSCDALKSVTIGNSVTSIGDSAFCACYVLESVTIPDSVTSIGDSAFSSCTALKSITIGNSVTSIGDSAFGSCEALESITIPNSVTSIGDSAFSWCTALKSVTIGNSVTSIGDWAFCACYVLESVTIPDSVTSIGGNAFHSCDALKSVTIGNSVTSIGKGAFSWCDALEKVYCKPIAPPSLGENVFDDPTIYVPNEGLTAYQSNSAWNVYTIEGYDF